MSILTQTKVITLESNKVQGDKSARRFSAKVSGIIAVIVLTVIVLSGLILLIREETRKVVFVIPPGTHQQLTTNGQNGLNFPDEIILTVGLKDTIIIENQDAIIHSFGPFVVSPQTTLSKRFEAPMMYEGACTFHEERQMRLVINPAPWTTWTQQFGLTASQATP